MSSRLKPKPTRYQERLIRLLMTVEDEAQKDMLIDIISLEQAYRNNARFPVQRLRDLVDSYATLLENSDTDDRGQANEV